MMFNTLLSGLLLTSASSPAPPVAPAAGDTFVVRVGRAETVSQGTIENAVVLVEDGKITVIGEDLPIERGIPVYDFPDWVVMPGLVNPYSRIGMDGSNGSVFEPHVKASGELFSDQEIWKDVLETGTTTLGLHPAGNGIPGQAVAVKPRGESAAEMILADSVYLQMELRSNARSKKTLRDAFKKVDDYNEKLKKAREKYEKDQEKKKKKDKSKKKDDEKKDEKKDEKSSSKKEEDKPFKPPKLDDKVKPFIALREGELTALFNMRKAADLLHLDDVIKEEDFTWSIRYSLPALRDNDIFEVAEDLGERELLVVMEPNLVLQASTRRERNVPAELHRAGAKIVLTPRRDNVSSHESWLKDVGEIVAAGLDRDAALAGVTLNAAHVLGLQERVGSLDAGKDANMVFWNGDPFEPGTEIQAVMLEGEFVYGEVDQ